MSGSWQFWALLSAGFAALTAIFAKVGIEGIDSDYATFIRTLVIIGMISLFLSVTGKWQSPAGLPARAWLFLVLSGIATGLSWLAYFRALQLGEAARVAPIDKLSIVLVAVFGAVFLQEKLTGINWLGVAMIAGGAILLSFRV
ncbi:MAG: EamA family transporter [Nitratireductor sp.]|nr:EamA family transporter [Nitratireductor sp.]